MEDASKAKTTSILRLCAKLLDAVGEPDAAEATRKAVVLADSEETR